MLYGSLVEAGGCLTAKFAEHFMESRVGEQVLQFSGALLSGIITVFGKSNFLIFNSIFRYSLNRNVCKSNRCMGMHVQLWRSSTSGTFYRILGRSPDCLARSRNIVK